MRKKKYNSGLWKRRINHIKRRGLNFWIKASKDRLSKVYGVENLSIIESWRLKKIVEECIEDYSKEMCLASRGEIDYMSVTEIEAESSARWLLRLYGITQEQVYDWLLVEDREKNGKVVFNAPRGLEYIARAKYRGKRYSYGHLISRTMKQYINRLREKSHLI